MNRQNDSQMNDAINLVKVLGSPLHLGNNRVINIEDVAHLISTATANKIPLYFMNTIRTSSSFHRHEALVQKFNELDSRRQSMKKILEKLGAYSSRHSIDWCVFKTVKPYPYVGSDIDLLLFGDDFERALSVLNEMGGEIEGVGPYSVTFFYPEYNFLVDLYKEISVTYMIYIKKDALRGLVRTLRINDQEITVLEPIADLLVNIGHSVYKEQFYALSDFYTATNIIAQSSDGQIQHLADLIKSQKLEFAAREFFELTRKILCLSFGRSNKLDDLMRLINARIDNGVQDTAIDLPYKYDLMTLISGFIDKVSRDELARSTALAVVKNMASNRKFLQHFIGQLVLHARRRSY